MRYSPDKSRGITRSSSWPSGDRLRVRLLCGSAPVDGRELIFYTIERKQSKQRSSLSIPASRSGESGRHSKKRPVDPRKKRAGGCSRSRFYHDSPTVKLVRGDQFWMLHAICADLRDRNIVVWRSQLGHQKQRNNEGVRPGGDPQHYRVSARNTHQLNTPPLQW